MPIVTLKNLSSGLRSFMNVDRQTVTLKSGESKTMELAPTHIAMIEREMKKPNATVSLTMSSDERELHAAELKEIGASNRNARAGARMKVPGRAIPPTARLPNLDRRFITDPAPSPPLDETVEQEAERVRRVVERNTTVKTEETQSQSKGKPKVERVPLKAKNKKEE